MKKHLLYTLLLAAAATSFVSCEDNRGNDMVPDKVYLRKYGIQEIATFVTNKGEVRFDLWAYKGGNFGTSGDVRYVVDPSLVAAYNETLGEDEWLKVLPEECYRIPYSKFRVSGDSPAAKFCFYYDPDVIAANYGTGRKFALPFRIVTEGIEANEEQWFAMLIFDVNRMQLGFHEYPMQTRELVKANTQFNEKLTLVLPGEAPGNIPVIISADRQSYVDEYNALYETDYTLMPAIYYSLENPEPVIQAGSTTFEVALKVSVEALPGGRYMIPVAIESAQGVDINPERRIFYFAYLNSDEWLAKDNWSIVNVSSNTNDGADSGGGSIGAPGPNKLIDGKANPGDDNRNYWGVNYGSAGLWGSDNMLAEGKDQWIILDLGAQVKVSAVKITSRGTLSAFKIQAYVSAQAPAASAYTPSWHDSGTPKTGYLYDGEYSVSTMDGVTTIADGADTGEGGKWTPVTDLLNGATVVERSLPGYYDARYVLFRIVECGKNMALSEIDVLIQK